MTRHLLLLLCLLTLAAHSQPAGEKKLVVLIVVDQMRQDQFQRFRPYFLQAEKGGFRRLAEKGVEHPRAYHDHHPLHTATGHSSLSTGALPSVHGIVGNRWPRKPASPPVDAGVDPLSPLVGTNSSGTEGVSPRDLLAPTLGDTFKRASGGRAKVITVAHKDRTAVLLGGPASDACLWFDESSGNWVSSRFYSPDGTLPPFVSAWNKSHHPDQDFGRVWTSSLSPTPPPSALAAPGGHGGVAGDYAGLGATFPHTINGGPNEAEPSPAFYVAWTHTPWAQHAAVDLALEAVDFYELGKEGPPDLLHVGLGSLDKVGHVFGPDSPEALEMLLETDRAVARLLDGIEQRVGLENCLVVLSSDHGATPLAEHLQKLGTSARRLPLQEFRHILQAALAEHWSPEDYHLEIADPHIYLIPSPGKESEKAAMLDALKTALTGIDGIKAVFRCDDLLEGKHRDTSWERQVARSVYPGRSGDLLMVFEPNTILGFVRPGGTNHGNPWTDDTNVPLLMLGWPHRGIESRTCAPRQLVATICLTLGLTPPGGCDAEPLPWALTSPSKLSD